MYSLWRAGVMLGRITPELPHDVPGTIIGILQPTAAFSSEHALIQSTWTDLSGSPTWQQPIPKPAPSGESSDRLVSVSPRVLSEADCVPIDQLLELRDSSGKTIVTGSITVMELPLANDIGIARLCAAAGVPCTGWYATAGLESPQGRAAGRPAESTN